MTANGSKASANPKAAASPDSGTDHREKRVSFESDKHNNHPLKLKKFNPKNKNGAKNTKEEPL